MKRPKLSSRRARNVRLAQLAFLQPVERRTLLSGSPTILTSPAYLPATAPVVEPLTPELAAIAAAAEVHGGPAAGAAVGGVGNPAPAAVTSINLHSNLSATKKLFINFYGDTVPTWSTFSPGTIARFSLDGDPTTLNSQEVSVITQIWSRVAQMYAPFNIDVTTEDPGSYAPTMVAKANIDPDSSWFQQTLLHGGVALQYGFQGGFGPAGNYAWVFPEALGGSTSVQAIADCVAHECGHLFGLDHHGLYNSDGSVAQQYDPGDPNYGPIMGGPYDSVRALWYRDRDVNGTAIVDDMAVIAGTANGFGYRPDEFGDTQATAGDFTYQGLNVTAAGVIAKMTDVDYIRFIAGPGAASFTVNASTPGDMLDVKVQLVDSSGAVKASSDRSPTVNSPALPTERVTFTLPAQGTYYLVISSHGNGGDTRVQDVGTYSITGTVPSIVPSVPVITGSTAAQEGKPTTLSAENSTGTNVLYEWDDSYDAGVGFVTTSQGQAVTITPPDNVPGVIHVALRVTAYTGITYLAFQDLTVSNVAPVVTGDTTLTIDEGSTGSFTPSFVVNDVAADLPTLTYSYDVDGDGTYELSGLTSPTFPIPAAMLADGPATFTVHMFVTDKDGGVSPVTDLTVNVADVAPRGTLSIPTSVTEGTAATISLVNVVEPGVADRASLRYDFDIDGDGTFDVTNSASPTYTYPAGALDGNAGGSPQNVSVRVRDRDGLSNVYQGTFLVTNVAPTATVTAPTAKVEPFKPIVLSVDLADPSAADQQAGFTDETWVIRIGGTSSSSGSILAIGTGTSISFTPTTLGDFYYSFTATDKDGGTVAVNNDVGNPDGLAVITVDELTTPTVTLTAGSGVTEGVASSVPFTLTLSRASLKTVTVAYSAVGIGGIGLTGQATGTVTFSPGITVATLQIGIADDHVYNPDQSVKLTLSSPVNAVVPTLTATVPVANDDISLVAGSNFPGSPTGDAEVTHVALAGSALDDNIVIRKGTKNFVNVYNNGVLVGAYFKPSRFTIDLGEGNDSFSMDASLKIPTMVFGGAGDDSLTGGGGNDILVGGSGADAIVGGKGSNLLIADDLSYAAASSQANTLFVRWNARGSNAVKLASLRTSGSPLAEGNFVSDASSDRVDLSSTTTDSGFGSGGDQRWLLKGKKATLLA